MHVACLRVTNRGYIDSAGCVASNDWTMRRSFPWLASLARSLFIVSQSPANTFVSRCTFLTGIRDNTTRSDRYVPNNLFAEYCDPGLIVPCKQCFSARVNAAEGEHNADIEGFTAIVAPKWCRYFRFVFPVRLDTSRINSGCLSSCVSFPLSRFHCTRYKARQSQNTITAGIE